jgi:hypothetical protein
MTFVITWLLVSVLVGLVAAAIIAFGRGDD